MVDHNRSHRLPSNVKTSSPRDMGMDVHTEDILDGLQRVDAIAALVESALIWRAVHIAWDKGLYPAEQLLVRLIYKEGCKNPQAMDLLAKIYFQQGRYDRAKALWEDAVAFQPGNPLLKRSLARCEQVLKAPGKALGLYRLKLLLKTVVASSALLLFVWGGVWGLSAVKTWMYGPETVHRIAGRLHYDYESQSDTFLMDQERLFTAGNYLSADELAYSGKVSVTDEKGSDPFSAAVPDGTKERFGFTRKKILDGASLGRVEVYVERVGDVVRASGKVPNLQVRYLVEEALATLPDVRHVDMQGLKVDQTYRVRKGDSLWIISRRLFGRGDGWTLLARYNNLENPSALRVGQELTLPLGSETLVPDR